MSRIKIAPNDSGTGIFTIESPNSNTNRTITLPDNAGNFLTTGSAGAVVQVVNATYNTQASSTSTSYADTGLTASITPSSASNKVLVLFSQAGCHKAGGNTHGRLKLLEVLLIYMSQIIIMVGQMTQVMLVLQLYQVVIWILHLHLLQ